MEPRSLKNRQLYIKGRGEKEPDINFLGLGSLCPVYHHINTSQEWPSPPEELACAARFALELCRGLKVKE